MSRKLIGCFCTLLLLISASWAVDLFVGTWALDVEKTKQSLKYVPEWWTIKCESLGNGYKVTSKSVGFTQVMTMDFKSGETAVRDEHGKEIDRQKLVRKSPLEIESTSLKTGQVTNWKILPNGEIELNLHDPKGAIPLAKMYFKRAS